MQIEPVDGDMPMGVQSSRGWTTAGSEVRFIKKTLRAQYVNNANFANTDKTWALSTPYDLRGEAMLDAIKANESNFARRAKNQQHKFYIHFKRKKGKSDSIVIYASIRITAKYIQPFLEKNH